MTIDPVSLGITLALTAASMAITASQHYEGPRVQDLKATVADYGTPLNNFKGRRVMNCSCPWAEDLQDHERNSKSKGGKMTTHYATGAWAIHVADHPIDSIRRIWFDEHLIYDRDGATQTFQLGDEFDLLDHMRFYLGTADQEPDPRIQAWTEAKYGPGTTSAWRFQSYIVFEDIPLDLIGNRYPQVKVEAEAGKYQSDIISGLSTAPGEDGGGYAYVNTSPDGQYSVLSHGLAWSSRALVFTNSRTGYDQVEHDVTSLLPGPPVSPYATSSFGSAAFVDNAGNVYGSSQDGRKTWKVALDGTVTQVGLTNDLPLNHPGAPTVIYNLIGLFDVGGTQTLFYNQIGGSSPFTGVIYSRPVSGGPVTAHDSSVTGELLENARFLAQDASGDVWAVDADPTLDPVTSVYFWRVVNVSGSGPDYHHVTGFPSITQSETGNYVWPTFHDGNFYVEWGTSVAGRHVVKVDAATFAVTGEVEIISAVGLATGDLAHSAFLGPGGPTIDTARNQLIVIEYTTEGNQKVHRIDLDTMALATASVDHWDPTVDFSAWPNKPTSSADDGVQYPYFSLWHDPVGGMLAIPHNPTADTVIDHVHYGYYSPDFAFLFMDAVHLRDFFIDWSLQGGLLSEEFDYSDLDQEVLGFSWTQGTPKQIGAYLLDVYDSDIVPHDFKLVGLKRGAASTGTLLTSEFVPDGTRYSLPETNDRDLPRRIFFNFADYDADQNPNSAVAQRLAAATVSTRELSVDGLSLAMTASAAKQSVDRYHRRTWFGVVKPTFSLTRRRLSIEPGDVWTPNFDGETLTCRCTKTTIGANGVTKTEWEVDDPALAQDSGAEGAPAAGHVPSTVFDPAGTIGDVLDIPLISDAHDQTAPFAYVVAGPDEDKPWPGAIMSQSDTGAPDSFAFLWDNIASSNGSIFGETDGALGEALPWDWDNGPALRVAIDSGELVSATEDELLNDGMKNLCAVKSGAGWELMQFRTATLVAELTYDLTGRLRGVRGTEQFISGHADGDEFIALAKAKVHTLGASEVGDADSYIATTTGQIPSDSAAFSRGFTAAAHKPYSPINGTLTEDGGDLLIDAVRRTRIGGNLLDGQDVPLGEASESWAADIYDGATFKRTITGTSLPLTYLAADRATDTVADLSVVLVQVDPTLNLRGYPLTITG